MSIDPISILDSSIKLQNEVKMHLELKISIKFEQLQLRVQQLEETAQSKEQELDQHKKITEGILTKMHHDVIGLVEVFMFFVL